MVETYNPKEVNVIVDGSVMTGFAEGTFVQAEHNEDSVVPYVGAQGEVSYAESADETGTITITLKSTSPSNRVLQDLYNSKRQFTTNIVDNNMDQVAGGPDCRVIRPANREYSGEVTEREWQIFVPQMKME